MHAAKTTPRADCLTVLCPSTQGSIRTTIATDVRTLTKAWHSKIKVSCPHCSEVHDYRVCEAYVEAALNKPFRSRRVPTGYMRTRAFYSLRQKSHAPLSVCRKFRKGEVLPPLRRVRS